MRIICTSDLHGNLPEVPEGDILLIAGDICPTYNHDVNFQKSWMTTNFQKWLEQTQKKIPNIVWIAGNHDFLIEEYTKEEYFPKFFGWDHKEIWYYNGIHYLQDNGVEINGLKIWGTPWQREFGGWAFNLKEEELAQKWELIPKDTDIIVCHGPAYGYGDLVKYPNSENVGSPSMLKKIEEIQPKLYLCGHIHEGYGIKKHGPTWMVNASLVNSRYLPTNSPILVLL
jgi:Icc-related predicted phosphoesterase